MAARMDSDSALLVLTMGVLLIYVELNRPGWVVPGAVGLTAALFAMASRGGGGGGAGGGGGRWGVRRWCCWDWG